MYVSIEVIYLEHFSVSRHPSPLLASDHMSHQMVFSSFLSGNIKQDAVITYEHSKLIIELF